MGPREGLMAAARALDMPICALRFFFLVRVAGFRSPQRSMSNCWGDGDEIIGCFDIDIVVEHVKC